MEFGVGSLELSLAILAYDQEPRGHRVQRPDLARQAPLSGLQVPAQ